MGMLRHLFRTFTRPYYVAVAQTIGDYVYKLLAAVQTSGGDLNRIGTPLKRFDTALLVFARNGGREVLRLAVEHWHTRIASPSAVAVTTGLFSDPEWLQNAWLFIQDGHPFSGNGLFAFQQALKDSGAITIVTYIEATTQPISR